LTLIIDEMDSGWNILILYLITAI